MASIPKTSHQQPRVDESTEFVAPLEAGDSLDQKTFHVRYEAMPKHCRAELVEGIVFMPSPLKRRHGRMHGRVVRWLAEYSEGTPGTDYLDNATDILGPKSEPQPDACLLVLTEKGGQTKEDNDGYMTGAPELIVEVATSTESYDLHGKKRDYERGGVKEYVVVALRKRLVLWFVLRDGKYQEMPAAADGIYRSEIFPGLWLDAAALLQLDSKRVLEVLHQGLASPEHAAFAAKLAAI